jgi:hypothetical protein
VTEEEKYALAWRKRRSVRWVGALSFLAYLPGMAALVRLFPAVPVHYFFFGWAAILIGAAGFLVTFRCPKCGNSFGSTNSWVNPIATKCLHCGMRANSGPS